MAQAIFGAGILWGTQKFDAYGNQITNSNPIMFGTLQDVSVDISFDTKELHGSNGQFPLFIARGKGKVECKAKMGTIKGNVFGNLFFGQGSEDGLLTVNYDTIGVFVPSTSPYEITVNHASSFEKDLGVINAVTGLPLVLSTRSIPNQGEYLVDVDTGVYTFSSLDAGLKVFINYSYSATSGGKVNTVVNVPMGYAPTFSVDLYLPYQGKSFVLSLNNCLASKLSLGTKLDDFTMPELDFSAFADQNGNVLTWSTTE